MVSGSTEIDVIVIGDGLIGLSTALELGRAGARVTVVGTTFEGAATPAAAGLLIPSVGDLPKDVAPFFLDSLAQYPSFVESLREFDPTLALIEGVIEHSATTDVLHERDGAIDNVRLIAAVRAALAAMPNVEMVQAEVRAIALDQVAPAVVAAGFRRQTSRIVLAAGAWAPLIQGLPRPLNVRPLKGQMIALDRCTISRSIVGDQIYLVPRGAETLVGATVEEAGFDLTLTPPALETLRRDAVHLCPDLAGASISRAWAGLRPATPDKLPILGPDPDWPNLIYACGHSKNGILLAPATASAISAACLSTAEIPQLQPFSVARFGN